MINSKYKYGCFIAPTILSINSNELSDSGKILLSKIIILSKNEGYCYALNSYLAEELGRTNQQISRGCKSLDKKGYINRKIIRNKNGQVEQRQIYLTEKTNLLLINFDNKQNDYTPPIKPDKNPLINNDEYSINKNIDKNNKRDKKGYLFKIFCKSHPVEKNTKKMIDYYLSAYEDYQSKKYPTQTEEEWVSTIKRILIISEKKKFNLNHWKNIINKHLISNRQLPEDYEIYSFIKNGYYGPLSYAIQQQKK